MVLKEEGGGLFAYASGDDNGESEGRSLWVPVLFLWDFFEYGDSFQGEVEEGEDSLVYIGLGWSHFFGRRS